MPSPTPQIKAYEHETQRRRQRCAAQSVAIDGEVQERRERADLAAERVEAAVAQLEALEVRVVREQRQRGELRARQRVFGVGAGEQRGDLVNLGVARAACGAEAVEHRHHDALVGPLAQQRRRRCAQAIRRL